MEAAKSTRRKSLIIPGILVLLAGTGLVLAHLFPEGPALTWMRIYRKLVVPLSWLLVYLAAGLLAGQAIESLGWTTKLARCVRPLTRWGHLKDESAAAFVSSFVSGIVANAMLMSSYREEKITRKELFLTYLLNNGLPVYLVHLPTTFFVVASLAGNAGLAYLGVTFLAACMRSIGVLLYTRFALPAPSPAWSALVDHLEQTRESPAVAIWKKFQDRFGRVVLYTVPIYILIFLAVDRGLFQWMKQSAAGLVSDTVFPIEAAGVVIFAMAAEFSSGMAAAGALLDAGSLSMKQTVLALLAGTIISTPLRAVRHQLPAYAGLFTLALGTQLLVLSQGLRILSLLVVAMGYAWWA